MADRSSLDEMPIHELIPMEKLDLIRPNEVRLLYYQNPSRFYLYLRQRINSHAQFQVELQHAMANYQSVASSPEYQRYQPVVAQDNHAVWHRATILDFDPNSTEVYVYFVDFGQEENISITNIRPLPSEFHRQPAFAIPCRLHDISSLDQSSWKSDDPVHDEFNRLMASNAICKICAIKEQICYDVAIEIPNVGDLGTFLFEQNLVSRINMRTTVQNTNQLFGRVPPGFADIQQPVPTRPIEKPIVQRPPSTPISTDSSSDISTLPPQDGNYIITQVYSAIEFYGHSQVREKELDAFHKHLEMIYNNSNTNDQSLSVLFIMDGVPCAIQQGEKYHRVVIKHRESESRVLVKLVDRGDEMIVDTSELLQLEKKYFTIPAFAQPFRLHNYDELHSTATITRRLKRLILNQRVHITQHLPMINGFYPVEMRLSDNQSVNQILLSSDPIPTIPPPPVKSVEVPTVKPLRINEDLPAPQKLLTAPPTNRFTPTEQTSRFSRFRQPEESIPVDNGHQSLMPEQNRPYNRGFSSERNGNNNRGGRNNEENGGQQRSGGFNSNRGGGFGDRGGRNNEESGGQRPGGFNSNRGGGFGDRGGRNNEENGGQRPGGFNSNRGGGFADRGNRNGFGGDRNNFENGGQRTGGFNSNHGARNGDFQDRNNQDEENNNGPQRFGSRSGYNSERRDRNGFQGQQDREEGGNNPRRGGFSGPRGGRGGFGDRGNRGGGGRGGFGGGGGGNRFRDNDENGFQSNEPMKTFSGWPNVKPAATPFESGDRFTENEIPKEAFQFVISHIEKCNDFFIQLYSKENELSALSDTLQKEFQAAPELNFSSIKINQPCLAKSSDNCWYRAVILKDGLAKTQVRFIDFGDTIELDTRTIRQLAKKFCLTPPYAYRCTLKNVQANETIHTDEIVSKCADQKFQGKIEKKTSDEKYLLQSENLEQLMLDIKAIQKTLPCVLVYIDSDKHQFYIQDDLKTMETITAEVTIDTDLPVDDIQLNSMVISTFEDAPYRAIIQADLDDNVRVYFVDYGNTNICPKTSLKTCPEQLKTYPYQAKRCQFSETSFNDLEHVYKQLDDYLESDVVTYSITNQTDDLFFVLLYINGECFNEKTIFSDQSNAITVERPGKRTNEVILSPVGNSLSTAMNIKRQKGENNSSRSHQGVLTYIDKTKPFVYLQLLPESESILEQINHLIEILIQENQHPSTYEIGDYVIAPYDGNHYRARIESYSSSTEFYTVYFLDYGNTEENLSRDHFYVYSNELKEISAQAHGYSLDQITSQAWLNKIQAVLEEKLNDPIDFELIDETQAIIRLTVENEIANQPKTFTANISGTNNDCFYIHILPDADLKICEMDELLHEHIKEHNQSNLWNTNDLCIVFDSEQNQYFRGKILSKNNDEQYHVQCIDYGNILSNISSDNLYLLTNKDLIQQDSLARQCRLHGVDDEDQIKAIKEIIRTINPTEKVTITVDNEQTDQCMFVMLFRENHEIVNDQFIKNKENPKTVMSTSSSDSAIAADNDETSNEQQGASPIGIPQAESTHQDGDTTNLTVNTINQTIDFGENDPSSSNTTIRDETENEH